mgnify:CR=1 FL=1
MQIFYQSRKPENFSFFERPLNWIQPYFLTS